MRNWKLGIRNFKLDSGFTLIELLIYSGLLSILLGVFVTLFGMIIDAQLESDSTSGVQQDGQYVLAKLSGDIENASSITTPASLGQSANTLDIVINSVHYIYSIDGAGNLIVTTLAGSDSLNSYSTSISNLNFTRLGNVVGKNTIRFTFKVTGRTITKTGQESQIATSTASLR